MVTLRRDVAVVNANRVFDRVDNRALTNYDIFMREKNLSAARREGGVSCSAPQPDNNHFGMPERNVQEPKTTPYKNYDEYMLAVLNRDNAHEKVLTKAEFATLKYIENNTVKSESKKQKRKLSRFSRIFIGAYVFVTVAVTAVILAVNLTGTESIPQKASADTADGISALAIEYEVEKGNWFDDMLDGISNK